jgi:hypothetical protein
MLGARIYVLPKKGEIWVKNKAPAMNPEIRAARGRYHKFFFTVLVIQSVGRGAL